jgi:transposase
MPDLDQSIRERVIALHQHTSKSHRDIANDLGLCQSTVTRLINRYQRLGTTATSRHKRCGRKSKLTTHDKRLLIRESVKDPTKTAQEIQKAVGNSVLNVSKRSIQRVLIAGGRKCYRPKKVHMLDQVKILRRYNWARRHSHKTQDFWNTVRKSLCLQILFE